MRGLGMRTSSSKPAGTPRSSKLLIDETRSRRVGIPGTLNGVRLRGRRKVETSVADDIGQEGAGLAGRKSGELEREYYEQLEALKFLIDPPPCFRNTETRQNFENKLNSLDLKLMNTVAIPDGVAGIPNGYREARGHGRFYRPDLERSYVDALDRRIIHLFAMKAPILKSRQSEQVAARENKTVRFKDEVEGTQAHVGQALRLDRESCEAGGAETSDRAKTEIPKEGPDDVGRPRGSSCAPDVETRNGR
jgi:hypothetical protein